MAPGSYTGSIAVIGKDLFIHATGVTFNGSAGVRTIQVSDGAHLKLFGMSVIDPSTDTNFGIALSCDTSSSTAATATVELDGVSIDSGYTTVLAQPCNVSIANSRLHCRTSSAQNMLFLPTSNVSVERSVIDGGDGVWCEGANSVARITNSVIKNQSGPDGAVVGSNVFGQGAGAMTVSFSTIVDSLVKCGSTPPRCAGGTGVGSCLESSIVANTTAGAPADSLQGAGCATTYSLVFPQTTSVGPNNVYGMSPKFQNGAGADYHLMMGSPAINTADPGATVSVDFDGIGRPQDGRSDMGAFEFKP